MSALFCTCNFGAMSVMLDDLPPDYNPHGPTCPLGELPVPSLATEPGDGIRIPFEGRMVEAIVRTKQTVRGAHGSVVLLGCQLDDRVDADGSWVTVVLDPVIDEMEPVVLEPVDR